MSNNRSCYFFKNLNLKIMINCLRRKIRVPLFIVLFFLTLFAFLFYKHVRNVHQRREMLNRFLFYKQLLYDVKLNVNDLKRKNNNSEINVNKLSRVLTILFESANKSKSSQWKIMFPISETHIVLISYYVEVPILGIRRLQNCVHLLALCSVIQCKSI